MDWQRRQPRVLFVERSERTSGRGTVYLAGWAGKSRVVAFKAQERNRYSNPLWQAYLQEPERRDEARQSAGLTSGDGRAASDSPVGELDDAVPF